MKKTAVLYLLLVLCTIALCGQTYRPPIEYIIADIYNQMSETDYTSRQDLEQTLYELYESPIDLNSATESDLGVLPFLTDEQIDRILYYAYRHSFDSIQELQLVGGFRDYEIRNLSYFVTVNKKENIVEKYTKESLPAAKEVFADARQEIIVRTDVRNIESFSGDPAYVQGRYRFNYRNRYEAGFTLRREPGTGADQLQYGGYISLHDLGPFSTIVAGNYQAEFGLGLVTASAFHMGKSTYVLTAGSNRDGLRKYSSTDGAGYHGLGGTMRFNLRSDKQLPHRIDASVWYSLTRANDSLRHHVLGANLNYHYGRLKIGLTAVENLYSDTLRYYYEHARYNQNYFRGTRQAVIGLHFRYNWGIADLFGEVATAQNKAGWGVATTVGLRVMPIQDLGLMLLYRYYSPRFDNTLGYSFSESSRINDENGIYLGIESKNVRHLRLAAYGDVFRFAGIKYGIPYAPSYGYDALLTAEYTPTERIKAMLTLRSKEKARLGTHSLRAQVNYAIGRWSFVTRADANLTVDSLAKMNYGYMLMQDVRYDFSRIPMSLSLHTVGFNAQQWNNRIYTYENDVLNGYSIPALYGRGGRWTVNWRYHILEGTKGAKNASRVGFTSYLRVSQTLYAKNWSEQHNTTRTKTDIHLLFHITF